MAVLAEIRAGLAANLEAALSDMQISAYLLSNPTPPAIEIAPAPIVFDLAMHRGSDELKFVVRAFVGLTTDVGAQKRLDLMLAGSGPESLKEAIESDCSLGGAIDDLRVVSASAPRVYGRDGQPPVLGAEWLVEIVADG